MPVLAVQRVTRRMRARSCSPTARAKPAGPPWAATEAALGLNSTYASSTETWHIGDVVVCGEFEKV